MSDLEREVLHQQLWAPWRLQYITTPKDNQKPTGCFLCQYLAEDRDSENLIVRRNAHTVTVLNRFPYNNGHLLIAPLAHKADLTDLTPEELFACTEEMQAMVRLLRKVMNPGGFNVGLNLGAIAGAGLPGHLHWHIVPRWLGDTNYMPVVAQVNVIPQSLDALHALLRLEHDDSAD
ncbi:MAG: HIT domain-containing protein [Planctomycetales bacterium]